jgi:parallel beta-helix repeat protein
MNRRNTSWCVLLGLLLGLLLPSSGFFGGAASAATYYVRKTGNDSNSGTSPSQAYKTFNKAISKASAGSIVYVGAGTYSENFSFGKSGGSGSRIIQYIADTTGAKTGDAGAVILADTSGAAINLSLKAYLSFTGFTVTGATYSVYAVTCNNLTFTNCTFSSATTGGIYVSSCSTTKFTGCTVSGNAGVGLAVLGTSGSVTFSSGTISSTGGHGASLTSSSCSLTLDHTKISGFSGNAVNMSAGTVNVICNLITGTGTGSGIVVAGTQATIWNNTLSNLAAGMSIACTATVKNNIMASVGWRSLAPAAP